ncbi:MAG: helix-hairpin-helix domain-containing protein [Nitrososphaeraceae archaeon]
MHINTDKNEGRISEDREVDLELQDVEGIGPTIERRLKEAGITSVTKLAATTPEQFNVDNRKSKSNNRL